VFQLIAFISLDILFPKAINVSISVNSVVYIYMCVCVCVSLYVKDVY